MIFAMRRVLQAEAAQVELEERGWSRLPRLASEAVERLRAVAAEGASALVRHALSSNLGFDELWGDDDVARRQELQARVGAIVQPFLREWFVDCRPVLFNVWIKRARTQSSTIKFHQDFSIVDERRGETAIQVWIPLVEVRPDNGALILVERTHLDAQPIRPHDFKHPLVDHPVSELPAAAVQPRLSAGEGLVFTNRTVHASTPNLTAEDRLAVGCILVPRGLPIAHWFKRAPDRMELWNLSDEDFWILEPGRLPPGAKLIETVEGDFSAETSPSSRLELADGGWLCFRPLPDADGRAVLTDERGRFLLLDTAEIDARKLTELGFARSSSRGQVEPNGHDAGVAEHLVLAGAMSDAIARGTVERIFESPAKQLNVELRGGEPSMVRRLVELARERNRAEARPLSFAWVTNLDGMTSEACDWLLDERIALSTFFDGPRAAHEANRAITGAPPYDEAVRWLRELHARGQARGIDPLAAYVNVLFTVTRATLAAGASAVVDACQELGLVYVQLQPLRSPEHEPERHRALACTPDEYLRFYAEALHRILALNAAGALLVEKRLALHLETLVSMADPRRAPPPASALEQLTYGSDGSVYSRAVGPRLAAGGDRRFALGHVETDHYRELAERAIEQARRESAERAPASGCAACVYDRYCGASLIRRYTMDDHAVTKVWGSAWCRTSMGTFDRVFTLLGSPQSATLRQAFQRWMAARDRVAVRR